LESKLEDQFLPYDEIELGWEAVYTGERLAAPADNTDQEGNVIVRWPLWTWTGLPLPACPEIEFISSMQRALGELDGETRRIRAHIASLAHCDNGIPITVDELLAAVGIGNLPDAPFHNGCHFSLGARGTRPHQVASIRSSTPY
jgi:hypothetical protein